MIMKPNYYERKVLRRAQGILQSCLISCRYYTWNESSDGVRTLLLILEPDTTSEKMSKFVEMAGQAFRKVEVERRSMALTFSDKDIERLPVFQLTFTNYNREVGNA